LRIFETYILRALSKIIGYDIIIKLEWWSIGVLVFRLEQNIRLRYSLR